MLSSVTEFIHDTCCLAELRTQPWNTYSFSPPSSCVCPHGISCTYPKCWQYVTMHEYVECGNGFGSGNLLTALYVLTSLRTNYKDVTWPTEGYNLDFSLHLLGQEFTCGFSGTVWLAPMLANVQHAVHNVSCVQCKYAKFKALFCMGGYVCGIF